MSASGQNQPIRLGELQSQAFEADYDEFGNLQETVPLGARRSLGAHRLLCRVPCLDSCTWSALTCGQECANHSVTAVGDAEGRPVRCDPRLDLARVVATSLESVSYVYA